MKPIQKYINFTASNLITYNMENWEKELLLVNTIRQLKVESIEKSVEADLEKARQTKYFKREGTPGHYKYYYTEAEYKEARRGHGASGDLSKDKAATIGEIREWSGKKYKKQPNGKWLEVSEHGMARREHEQEIKYHQKVEENRGNEISDRRKAQDEQDKHHKAASKLSDKEFSDEEVGLGVHKKGDKLEHNGETIHVGHDTSGGQSTITYKAPSVSDKTYYDLDKLKEVINEKKKDFKEMSFSERLSALKDAPNGAIASGGGYGPFIKIGKNSWQNKVTKTLMHSEALRAHIGGFNDFKIK